MEKERIEKMKKSELNPFFVFVHPKSIGSLMEWLKERITYKNRDDEVLRTFQIGPHTFQAIASIIQDEYFQKQLKLIRAYIDFGTLENFDLLIKDDDFHFHSDIDEQVDQLINLLLPNLPERLSCESKLKYLDFGISLPIKIGTNEKKTDEQVVEKLTSSSHFLEKLSLAGQGYLNFYIIRNICKNGKTLQALDLSRCYGLTDGAFQDIVKNCDNLLELNLDFVGDRDVESSNNFLSSESVSFFIENLTPKIMKLSLLNQNNVRDEHVKTLLTRCNRITEFNICSFKITYIVATYVAQTLSNSLVKLGIELPMSTRRISRAMLNELKSMSKLKHVCIPPWNYYEELKVLYPFIDFSEQRFQIAMPYSNNEQETKFKLWDICAKQSDLF